MSILFSIIALVCAYLIGSFPTPYIISHLRGIDIREVGSRNMGSMNVFYNVGFWYGILTLVVDIGKGVAAVALAGFLTGSLLFQMLAGGLAVLGHALPVFLKFRGGKGGATVIGVLIYLLPWGTPVYAGLFGIILLLTRFPTLSYSLAFLCFPFIGWLVYHNVSLIVFSIAILLIPGIRYIPRVIEMRRKSGSWKHFFMRRSVNDRL